MANLEFPSTEEKQCELDCVYHAHTHTHTHTNFQTRLLETLAANSFSKG